MNLAMYFVLFIIYSFIGWIIEIIYTLCTDKKIVNRGFLIGPYCPIYGSGCILMILLLERYLNDPIVLFVMAIAICATIEYLTSFVLEKIFDARWWDYSTKKFNINGRICLETIIPFGLLGLLLMYVINPFVSGVVNLLPDNILNIISIILFIAFIFDVIISFNIISKIRNKSKKIITKKETRKDNTEEISKKVREYIKNYSKFGNRLIDSFPNFSIKRKNSKEKK